jgi:hypothetical protein
MDENLDYTRLVTKVVKHFHFVPISSKFFHKLLNSDTATPACRGSQVLDCQEKD